MCGGKGEKVGGGAREAGEWLIRLCLAKSLVSIYKVQLLSIPWLGGFAFIQNEYQTPGEVLRVQLILSWKSVIAQRQAGEVRSTGHWQTQDYPYPAPSQCGTAPQFLHLRAWGC